MRFETSRRFQSSVDLTAVNDAVERQFSRISEKCFRGGNVLTAKGIEATFGSIQRNDVTFVTAVNKGDGYALIAETEYKPSILFWVFFVCGLFGYVFGALIPVAFYLYHKKIVRDSVESALLGVDNELRNSPAHTASASSVADELQKLAALRDSGIITDQEMALQKHRLLAS